MGTGKQYDEEFKKQAPNFCKQKRPESGLLVQSALNALLPASSLLPAVFSAATGRAT